MSKVKDPSLAPQGRLQIEWAAKQMPVVSALREEFAKTKPFKGLVIGGAIHVTKETANLILALRDGGAEVAWAACNPLSTQDDVAAALAEEENVHIYAWKGLTNEDYYKNMDKVLEHKPVITMDDGGDLVFRLHEKHRELIPSIKFGTEETTTGVVRLRNMAADKKLGYPVISINDAITKQDFDNIYGTAQGTFDAIMRATSVLIAGRTVVVAGFGHCGKGVALRARGMNANVIVTEVSPVNALRAVMEGFRVMPMKEAAKVGDIFVTATGVKDILTNEHFELLKDGVILSNVGHFNLEIRTDQLQEASTSKRTIRSGTEEYTLKSGKKVFLLGEGRLANLACAEGHPSAVMDLSFANQLLSIKYYLDKKLEPGVYSIPKGQDDEVARRKLQSMGCTVDALTKSQEDYITSWSEGT
ncbi:MAG: adenosylhomocysteinase [Nanoarchaeota archaeon]|nr:adenosylhomocysteinase [Nanoarchaeota archaeon]